MIAGKRVPAAYRKNNRVSHLTADAVRQMGYIVEPSGQKLTIGRRNRQRGGGDSDDEGRDVRTVPQPQPEPQASPRESHWAVKVEHARRKAFVRRHLPDETQQSGADALVQMDRAADSGLANAVSSMGGSPRKSTATERAQFFVEDHNAKTSGRRITKALQAKIFERAAAMDADDPDDARGRRAALLGDRGTGPVFTKPFDAASYMGDAYGTIPPELFEQPMALYQHLQGEIATLPRAVDQIAALRFLATDIGRQGANSEERQEYRAIAEDIPRAIQRIEEKQRVFASQPSVHTQHVDTPESATPASTLHHAQDDHDTSLASTQWSISEYADSPVRPLNLSPRSARRSVYVDAANVARARDSAGDPETLAAIGRLSTAAENARTDVDYRQIPAVAAALESDPQLADLVRRGLLNPRRLSDPLYAQRIKQQLNRRESDVRATDGQRRYSTATSQPQMLQRGRIARSKAPVFERVGNVPSRSTPGLKYYRRAMATRAPIFSAA